MTFVDAVVVGVLAVGFTLGMVRGFVSQFTGIAGLFGGLWLAAQYHERLRAAVLDPNMATGYNGLIAFAAIVVVTVFAVATVGWAATKVFDKLEMGAYDRLMGGAFGGLKAALICSALLLGAVYFAPNGGRIEQTIGQSRAGPLLWRGMDSVASVLPGSFRGNVQAFLKEHRLPSVVPERDDTAEAPAE